MTRRLQWLFRPLSRPWNGRCSLSGMDCGSFGAPNRTGVNHVAQENRSHLVPLQGDAFDKKRLKKAQDIMIKVYGDRV